MASRRRKSTARRSSARKASPIPAAKTSSASGSHDLAAMYLSILIVGVAGLILLIAKPTQMMQKVIGVLLIILGLWGLMIKKN